MLEGLAVRCPECAAYGPAQTTPEAAVFAWNLRAVDGALDELPNDLSRLPDR